MQNTPSVRAQHEESCLLSISNLCPPPKIPLDPGTLVGKLFPFSLHWPFLTKSIITPPDLGEMSRFLIPQ